MLSLLALILAGQAMANDCGFTKMENLVTFGDSLTDDTRNGWFGEYSELPPEGEILPIWTSAGGGATWARIAANASGANFNNYAVAGGGCSWELVESVIGEVGFPFPSVMEYGIPTFENETTSEVLYPDRRPDNTVYDIWVGPNDLATRGYLMDSQTEGKLVRDLPDCIWNAFDRIYATGGRYFVVNTIVPLEETPLFLPEDKGGVDWALNWRNKTDYNQTHYEQQIMQYSTSVNALLEIGTPFHLKLKNRWPGATFVVFDTYKLMTDMLRNASDFLEAPAEIIKPYGDCRNTADPMDCDFQDGDVESYFWWDEIHITERTAGIIGKEFVKVVEGESDYAKYYYDVEE